jgi:hypothetical protein
MKTRTPRLRGLTALALALCLTVFAVFQNVHRWEASAAVNAGQVPRTTPTPVAAGYTAYDGQGAIGQQTHPGRISGGLARTSELLAPAAAINYVPNTFTDPDVSVTHHVNTANGHILNNGTNTDTGVVSLRSAIIAANNNVNVNPEVDTITLGTGTYALTIPAGTAAEVAQPGNPNIGDVDVTTTGLTINGNGPALTTIQQTSGIDRVIDVNPPFLVGNFFFTLNGVTITGGRSTSGDAGGLYSGSNDTGLATKGKITINNCVFKNNTVTNPGFGGGGMQNFGGDLDVINTTFGGVGPTDPNSADKSGGGLAAVGSTNAHTINITGSTFTNNVSVNAGSGGGGLDLAANGAQSNGTTANITNCTFTGNQAQGTASGGGIINESLITTVTNTSFTNNFAANRGGGIYVGGGSLHLNSSSGSITFTGNTAGAAAATSMSTASAVTVSGTNVSIGGSIEISTLGSWTNNPGSTLSPTNVVVTGGTFNMNNSTMNVSGNLTIGPGAIVGSTFNGNTGTVNIQGNFVLNAGGAPATTLNAGTGTFNFNGTGAQSITNGTAITFFNLTDSNTTQPLTANNSFAIGGTLNINGANATLSPVAASIISGTGTLTGSGTARVTRATGANDFLTQYTITNKTLTNLLVDYAGAGAQGISGTTYTNVRLNNASGGTLSAPAIVNGTLTLASGAFNVGTSTLTLNNVITPAGGSLTSSATGTVNYNQASAGQNVIAGNYGNLTFSNQNKVLAGTGTIGIAAVFTPGTAAGHTITGSTIDFNGTGAQTIPAFNYNNLTISGARGVNNVTLINAGTIGIAGAFSPAATFAGGVYVVTNNTVDFNGGGSQTISAFNYNNLTSSNSGARSLANAGTIGIANAFAPGTNIYTITGSTINFNGAGAQTIPAFNYNNLTSSNGAAARTLAGAGVIGIAGAFAPGANVYTILGSTVDFNGSGAQTISAFNYNDLTSSNSGARTLANAGTIGVFGNFTQGSNVYTITGSTINFNGTGPQNIPAFNYNNLTSSSTGARTLANSGVVGVAGTFTPGANVYTATGSTISYNGAAQSIAVFPYNNLSTAGSGIKSLTGATTVVAVLTIGSSTTLDVTASNFALNVAGNFTNNGTFSAQAGTVTLNGSSLQTIGGTAVTTFFNLIVNNAGGVNLGLNSAVNGLLTLTAGSFNIGTNTLTLNDGTSVGGGSLNGASGTTIYGQGSNGQVVLAGNYNNLTFSNFNKVLPNAGTIGISGTFTPGSAVGHTIANSTIDFNGAGAQTIPAFSYFNLTSSNSGNRTLASSGTVGIGGAFTPGTNTYTITGSTINFNGSGAQTIPAFNYNNLTSSSTGARTLASSGIMRIAGVFTPGTNVYTITGSTIEYNGALAQTIPAGFATYNNLTLNNAAGATLGGNTAVNGIYNALSGTLNVGSNTLTLNGVVNGTGSFNSNANGTVNYNQGSAGQTILLGNYGNLTFSNFTKVLPNSGIVSIAGAFTVGAAGGHTVTGSTVQFNGTAAQTLPAAFTPYNNLTFNNSVGLNLGGNITVNGILNFITGEVNTGANTLIVSGTGSSARTSGHVVGTMQKLYGGSQTFTFHVGTAGVYSPVDANGTAGTGSLSVMANTGNPAASPALDTTKTLRRFWTLSGSGITADLKFFYQTPDVFGTETNYTVIRVTGSTAIATPNGVPCPGSGSPCVDAGANTIALLGVQSFNGSWTAGELAPTAAEVGISGQVLARDGRGVPYALVTITDRDGNVRTAITNPFGYYRFIGVQAGATYGLAAESKKHRFAARSVTVNDNLDGVNIVEEP